VSETLFACFVLAWFIIILKFWDRGSLKHSVLCPRTSIVFSLLRGLFFGFCLIFITYAISRSTGVLAVKHHPIEGVEFVRILFVSIVATAFTAFWEELAFRGFILKKLLTGIGRHQSCLLVALIFGLLHLLSPVKSVNIVISTVFSGLLLNYAFLYSENLYFPIGIHFSWNFFLGKIFYSKYLFEVEYVNKIWAGYKNPEEGIIAISITAAGLLIVLLCRKKLQPMS
jgi:membrane protease YdiL (CAAX protease family)